MKTTLAAASLRPFNDPLRCRRRLRASFRRCNRPTFLIRHQRSSTRSLPSPLLSVSSHRTHSLQAPQQQQQQQYVPQPIQYQQQPINLGFAPSNAAGGKWTHDLYTGPQQAQQVAPAPVKKVRTERTHMQ